MSLTITKWILCFFFCLVMLLLESNVICSHHIRYIHLKGFSSNVICNEIVICSHHIGIYTLERFFFNVICNEIDCVNKNNLFILKKSVTASTSIDFSSRLYNLLIRAIRLNRNNSASLKPPENTLPITSEKLAGCHRDDFHKGFKNGYQFDFKIFFFLNRKMSTL